MVVVGHNDQTHGSVKKECMCAHGMCLNHNPEWVEVDKERTLVKPLNFWFFKINTFIFVRCCGKGMNRYRIEKTYRCKKCGRIKKVATTPLLAICHCCGYHHAVPIPTPGGDY
jgi:hypothetical protein